MAALERAERLERENAALRELFSRLSAASVRILSSLDLETVLQNVLDTARSLIGARYGVLTLLDEQGEVEHHVTSGISPDEARRHVSEA